MKRSIEQTAEFVAEEVAYGKCGKSLEVPYAFGKLNVVEMVDPVTNVPTGVFNVMEADRGFSFGTLRLNREEERRTEVDCMNERFLKLNTTQQTAAPKQQQQSTMLQQKKENDYLPVAVGSNGRAAKVGSARHCVDNLCLPREASLARRQWGSLGFYCQGELLYTHCLWGDDEPVRVCASTLKDVQVAPRFAGGPATRESLAEDFRTVLAKGFTLQRNSHDQTVRFVLKLRLDQGVTLVDLNSLDRPP